MTGRWIEAGCGRHDVAGSVSAFTSVWEIAIKAGLGKLRLPQAVETFVPEQMHLDGIGQLAIDVLHAARVEGLPPHPAVSVRSPSRRSSLDRRPAGHQR